jgi:predicted nucleic acid-binding Zn ribbon protein
MAIHEGEMYRCEKCGAEIQVTRACSCPPDPATHCLRCCGQEMKQVQSSPR